MSFRLTKKILATIQPIIYVVTADPTQLATPFVQAFINDHFDAFRAYDLKQIKEFKKSTGIHICVNHTGKMKNIPSLSTSPLHRPAAAIAVTPRCSRAPLNPAG